jgi:hypothetical protein
MRLYFALKSTLSRALVASPAARPPRRPRTGAEWVAYFRANAGRHRPVPWRTGPRATPEELAAIVPSLRAWQLGETSDGNHLRAAAGRYARRFEDPDYLEAVELFIREEQRHGELLGQFLDRTGVGRAKADWGDSLFRFARYFMTDIEVWTTPVVMVETLALVYYNAIRHATGSAALREICAQILADEVPHLRFACERLASLFRHRGRLPLRLTLTGQRVLFRLVATLVWVGHRRALRAGGYGWRRYWRVAREKMNTSWLLMDPSRYDWPPDGGDDPAAACARPATPPELRCDAAAAETACAV